MPRFDGTGPEGKGPMTGRGIGKCKGGTPANAGKPFLRRGAGFKNRRGPGSQGRK